MRQLTYSEVEFEVIVEPDDMPVEGSFASGDDAQDREDEQRIMQDLERGFIEAWCIVTVQATWYFGGGKYRGRVSLGGVNCKPGTDMEKYAREQGLYHEALEALNSALAKQVTDANNIAEFLR